MSFPVFFFSHTVIDCGEPKPLLNGGVIFLSGFQNQYQSVIEYYCNEPFYALFGGPNGETSAHSDKQHSFTTKSQIQLNIISMLTGKNYFPQPCPLITIILTMFALPTLKFVLHASNGILRDICCHELSQSRKKCHHLSERLHLSPLPRLATYLCSDLGSQSTFSVDYHNSVSKTDNRI